MNMFKNYINIDNCGEPSLTIMIIELRYICEGGEFGISKSEVDWK